jgi:hypothetical protein
MKGKEFMRKHRVDGQLLARNGRRMYVERCPGFVATYRSGYIQTAYVDLDTFTAHTRCDGPDPKVCQQINTRAQRRLTALARLARIQQFEFDQ